VSQETDDGWQDRFHQYATGEQGPDQPLVRPAIVPIEAMKGTRAMRRTLIQQLTGWALAVIIAGTMTNPVTAGSFTRQWAARDMQVLMMIEEYERADAIAAQTSTEAILRIMQARFFCFEGRVLTALAIYDSIVKSVTAKPITSDPAQ
jgi:hypothetical protein